MVNAVMNILSPKQTIIFLFLASLMATGQSSAAILEIKTDPTEVVLGYELIYTAVDDGLSGNIDHYEWTSSCSCNPNNAYIYNSGTDDFLTDATTRTGTFTTTCKAFYEIPEGGTVQPTSEQSIAVTISGPDDDRGIEPQTTFGVPVFLGEDHSLEVKFEVLSGGKPIGPYVDGYAQERIWHPNPNTGLFTVDSGWSGPDGLFYFSGDQYPGLIYDLKRLDADPGDWAQIAIGDFVDDFKQQHRMMIRDCCDQYHEYIFPKVRHMKRKKHDNDSWSLWFVMP